MREALVSLDRTLPALADQLTNALRDAISQGRLAPGTRLPSTRALAADLALSRGVVVDAYEQLVAEGHLVSRRGSGTVVAPLIRDLLSRRADDTPEPLPDQRPVLLRPGVPDLGMFPRGCGAGVREGAHRDAGWGVGLRDAYGGWAAAGRAGRLSRAGAGGAG
ncbi:GntR family transcriptional regulator [Phytohabitans rumicis]|uniref:HTH gntR-type domain-containing protein n=1 Tax=Phytohabitans rumicis TaxID=1076125 RepID=A0A6V8L3U6_9ACTN|nr:GntR family transcriptional regulator [Phytohabitans rumicis]GFJ89638.1 hypothetical protein Prum_032800 [Phytohabitans rumicis]